MNWLFYLTILLVIIIAVIIIIFNTYRSTLHFRIKTSLNSNQLKFVYNVCIFQSTPTNISYLTTRLLIISNHPQGILLTLTIRVY